MPREGQYEAIELLVRYRYGSFLQAFIRIGIGQLALLALPVMRVRVELPKKRLWLAGLAGSRLIDLVMGQKRLGARRGQSVCDVHIPGKGVSFHFKVLKRAAQGARGILRVGLYSSKEQQEWKHAREVSQQHGSLAHANRKAKERFYCEGGTSSSDAYWVW
nr:hypothetical protein Iba_chr03fCG3400 [Ipomoea batatas]